MTNLEKFIILVIILLIIWFNTYESFENTNLYLHYEVNKPYIFNDKIVNLVNNDKKYDATLVGNINEIIDYNKKNRNQASLNIGINMNHVILPPIKLTENGITISCSYYIQSSDKNNNVAILFDIGEINNQNCIRMKIYENNYGNEIELTTTTKSYKANFILPNTENDKWHDIKLTIVNIPVPSWKLYYDNQLVRLGAQDIYIYPLTYTTKEYNFIGRNNINEYSTGTFIDDFKIYNGIA